MDQHEVVDGVAAQDLAHDLRQRLDGQRRPGVGDGVLERVHERALLREQRPAALRRRALRPHRPLLHAAADKVDVVAGGAEELVHHGADLRRRLLIDHGGHGAIAVLVQVLQRGGIDARHGRLLRDGSQASC